MTAVYLAGPMRGIDQFNFPAFDEAARNLRSLGWTVFSPAEHDRESGFDETRNTLEGFDIKQAFQWDCNRVCEADHIVLLPGWEKSQGVAAELTVARMVGTEVRYYTPGAPWPVGESDPFHQPAVEDLIPDLSPTGEVRSVNATTGAEKGVKEAAFDLIPPMPLYELASHYGRGARKYKSRNWEKGYEWSKSFAAMQRHAWLFWQGEDNDPETGSSHLTAVAWHAFALLEWTMTHPELDDRPL